ncbi:MAG: hypothetical protein L0Y80_08555 [Ignavibacteriae bacterium]|nr:hypothetical protein [Ignavibacteriota bacterium]
MRKHFLLLLCFTLAACGGGSDVPPELERAASIVEDALQPSSLERSSFPVVLPEGTPLEFVSWYFSTLGTAEWPPREDDPEAAGMPDMKMPIGVSFVHTAPNVGIGKQIVLKWNDERGVVIVEGYVDPLKQPMFVKEFTLPKVTSKNPLAQIAAQEAIAQGASYQAF